MAAVIPLGACMQLRLCLAAVKLILLTTWDMQLPGEAGGTPSMEVLQAKLNGALSKLESVPAHGRSVELDEL